MPQTASAWTHTYLGTPMVNGRFTQYSRNHHFPPKKMSIKQPGSLLHSGTTDLRT